MDADTEADVDPRQDDVEIGEMKSKPSFGVDIIRDNRTLGFTCLFNNQPGASGADDSYDSMYIYCNNFFIPKCWVQDDFSFSYLDNYSLVYKNTFMYIYHIHDITDENLKVWHFNSLYMFPNFLDILIYS